MNALSRQYFALDELCSNLKNRYKNLIYLCFPEYELIFKKEAIYSEIALSFIEKYPHTDIISNTRIDCLENFFKKHNFRYWKRKANIIKEYSKTSYPSVNMNDELVSNLSQISRLINNYQKEIEIIKYKLIFLGKKSKYFEHIFSIFGIGEFTTSLIIAELGDINRFNNIKELTAYCGLDPSIKQSIVRLSSKCHVENDIEIYYRKKRNEGKHHYAAIIACTTKLLRQILALCKQLDK